MCVDVTLPLTTALMSPWGTERTNIVLFIYGVSNTFLPFPYTHIPMNIHARCKGCQRSERDKGAGTAFRLPHSRRPVCALLRPGPDPRRTQKPAAGLSVCLSVCLFVCLFLSFFLSFFLCLLVRWCHSIICGVVLTSLPPFTSPLIFVCVLSCLNGLCYPHRILFRRICAPPRLTHQKYLHMCPRSTPCRVVIRAARR